MRAKNFKELQAKMAQEVHAQAVAEAEELIQQLPLNRLRSARSMTQQTLAEALGVTQSEISRLERRTDIYLSTLRRFIEAMGGELEIVAVFPDGRKVLINQLEEAGEQKALGVPERVAMLSFEDVEDVGGTALRGLDLKGVDHAKVRPSTPLKETTFKPHPKS